jgi:transcriptional regulator with XRE-family HTH domain
LLKIIGRLLGEHRIQRKLSQYELAKYSGFGQSKITKIERGVYPGLSVQDFCYLADDLDLDISIRLLRKGVLMQTRTGSIEYFPEATTGAAHCSGQGFTIVWQKGALVTQSDRNGATVEDILCAALKRLDEFQSGDFHCPENQMAMECLTKATHFLRRRQSDSYRSP